MCRTVRDRPCDGLLPRLLLAWHLPPPSLSQLPRCCRRNCLARAQCALGPCGVHDCVCIFACPPCFEEVAVSAHAVPDSPLLEHAAAPFYGARRRKARRREPLIISRSFSVPLATGFCCGLLFAPLVHISGAAALLRLVPLVHVAVGFIAFIGEASADHAWR